MNPIEPEIIYGKLIILAKDQPEYNQLPIRLEEGFEGYMLSKWQFSVEERQAIADGASLYLRTMTFNQPFQPVNLWVE